MVDGPDEPKRNRKAIDCHKPRLVVFRIPPSDKVTEVTIDVDPKARRAYANVPPGTEAKFTDKP